MARVLREVCKCDVCGWEWIPKRRPKPKRCGNVICRSRRWNQGNPSFGFAPADVADGSQRVRHPIVARSARELTPLLRWSARSDARWSLRR